MAFKTNTLRALAAHSAAADCDLFLGDKVVTLQGVATRFEIHQCSNGRWIIANYDERGLRYVSYDVDAAGEMSYAFGGSLDALEPFINSYSSPAAAARKIARSLNRDL